MTLLYMHDVCVEHSAGYMHPESPERLKAIEAALAEEGFEALERRIAPLGSVEQVKMQHDPRLVDAIFSNIPLAGGWFQIDADTAVSNASGEASLRAVGGLCEAVDEVMKGNAKNAFCAMRPPGHHAEYGRSMGFCLFNNVAIGAEHARRTYGAERVAVIDFDVHHGNGTQAMLENDPNMFYGSTHQSPCYPGTGDVSETGIKNNIVNAPLSPGAGSQQFREAMETRVLPKLSAFKPDLLLISAGFDGHSRDPLAQLKLETDDFDWVTRKLIEVADSCCDGRLVSTLEGGYDLTALAESVSAHVKALMKA